MTDHLALKLQTLPLEPGCYLMKNATGKIIYVGKAKKLKNRVSSYFTGAHNLKTAKMVSQVVDFDIIITSSEREALILEINLIKKHRPRYNILLMDDKSYPFIRMNKEGFPYLRVVREKKQSKDSFYYGPYPDAGAAYHAVKVLNDIFPTRKCFPLKKKKCLYFHLGQCLAPCEETLDEVEVDYIRANIKSILSGNLTEVTAMLHEKMVLHAEKLEFEQANLVKNQIDGLKYIVTKQSVQTNDKTSMDVFNYALDKGYISGVGLFFRKGQMLQKNMILQPLEVNEDEAMTSFITQYYQQNPIPPLIVVPQNLDTELLSETLNTKVQTFVKGHKHNLLTMAYKNAQQQIHTQFEKIKVRDDIKLEGQERLSKILNHPVHQVEMIDVSHLSGSFSVGACVVYVQGEPDKSLYRKYKLHQANDDRKSMQEMVYRRFLRVLKQEEKKSDVLIVDGGALQVEGVREVLNSLEMNIPIVGLIKDDYHNTKALYLNSQEIIDLDKTDQLYLWLALIQDEVHRFAISYHRQLRSKGMTRSLLDELDGVGPKRKKLLMNHFGSLKKIKEASAQDLSSILGKKVGEQVYNQLRQLKEGE